MNADRARLLDLLADDALGSLAPADRREFERLLAEHRDVPQDVFTSVIARIDLSRGFAEVEEMPAEARNRIAMKGREWVANRSRATELAPRRTFSILFAAAAAAVIAAFVFLLDPERRTSRPTSPTARFDSFVASGRDVLLRAFEPGPDPDGGGKDVAGELAWSTTDQSGFLRVRGLERNDPSTSCYQLWIFDRARDERYPVDGGVFDCSGDEVIVPIDAKVRVTDPTLFAVTVEKAGGVVVSGREHIVAIATP